MIGRTNTRSTSVDFDQTSSETSDGFTIEALQINSGNHLIPVIFLHPEAPKGAVLYCHAHGNRPETGKSELLHGRPALLSPPLGPVLAAGGYAVLCLDMPGFGDRMATGTESALAKAALWRGETLFGQMIADLVTGLDFLTQNPVTRDLKIATFGISMGATHAYWLAALDTRVAACAHLCAFSNIAGLIEARTHDLHGPYMTIPGLLPAHDMCDVAALIAPRPQLIGAGVRDPLTPDFALRPALNTVKTAYDNAGALDALQLVIDPDSGHAETPEMRAALLAFLERTIAGA